MTKWLLLFVSFGCFAGWEDVTPALQVKANTSYFNATVTQNGDWWNIESHTNSGCQYSNSSGCRKGLLAYTRNGYDTTKARKHSFDFELVSAWLMPEFLIVYQDWVRVHSDDVNGNRPITTLKIRAYGEKLYLQHWENSWQWAYDPNDYDTHLVTGRETMRGEIEIKKGVTYHIEVITQDFAGTGRASLVVDGVTVSDAVYLNSHPDKYNHHSVMTGMYWSKGFNSEHDPANRIVASYGNIKHHVLRF